MQLVSSCLIFANTNHSRLSRWSPSLRMVGDGGQLSEFIDGLGPGQLVGRQVLGAPALGDIQLSLCYQKGFLEVEVIRARGLQVCFALQCQCRVDTDRFAFTFTVTSRL
jgi:hypothetical protein